MIRRSGWTIRQVEHLGMLERRPHPLGDVLRMDEKNAVLVDATRSRADLIVPAAVLAALPVPGTTVPQ